MMITKVEIFLGGEANEAKSTDFIFCGSSHFSASRYPRTPPKLQKMFI